jgi:hypothetical protein
VGKARRHWNYFHKYATGGMSLRGTKFVVHDVEEEEEEEEEEVCHLYHHSEKLAIAFGPHQHSLLVFLSE